MNALRYFLKILAIYAAVLYAVVLTIAWFAHAHKLPTGCAPVGEARQVCTYEVR